jgi:histidine triad (HIT) family protein
MASIFTKIVKGEIPAYKIAEDENFLAFLDVFPLAKGHVIVIPKQEIDSIFDLSDESYTNLWLFAKKTVGDTYGIPPVFDIFKNTPSLGTFSISIRSV